VADTDSPVIVITVELEEAKSEDGCRSTSDMTAAAGERAPVGVMPKFANILGPRLFDKTALLGCIGLSEDGFFLLPGCEYYCNFK